MICFTLSAQRTGKGKDGCPSGEFGRPSLSAIFPAITAGGAHVHGNHGTTGLRSRIVTPNKTLIAHRQIDGRRQYGRRRYGELHHHDDDWQQNHFFKILCNSRSKPLVPREAVRQAIPTCASNTMPGITASNEAAAIPIVNDDSALPNTTRTVRISELANKLPSPAKSPALPSIANFSQNLCSSGVIFFVFLFVRL